METRATPWDPVRQPPVKALTAVKAPTALWGPRPCRGTGPSADRSGPLLLRVGGPGSVDRESTSASRSSRFSGFSSPIATYRTSEVTSGTPTTIAVSLDSMIHLTYAQTPSPAAQETMAAVGPLRLNQGSMPSISGIEIGPIVAATRSTTIFSTTPWPSVEIAIAMLISEEGERGHPGEGQLGPRRQLAHLAEITGRDVPGEDGGDGVGVGGAHGHGVREEAGDDQAQQPVRQQLFGHQGVRVVGVGQARHEQRRGDHIGKNSTSGQTSHSARTAAPSAWRPCARAVAM